jgi:NNP family nitrate/nitrite transporter-like MFS transporter
MLLYGATCVSLVWMHYTFAKEHQEMDQQIAKDHAYEQYARMHENPDEYAAARAAVEQAGLLEELIEKYNAARKKAELEADQMRQRQRAESVPDSLE